MPPSTAGGAVEVATGSGILELMAVEGLTLNQVNSHLNYCRIKYGALPKSSNRFPPMIALQTPQSSEGATELLCKIARPIKHGKVFVDLFGSLGGLAILH
ncbi:hypothetical protein RHGRI_028770 [Rhododendron griersonianum]|uniref:Uncharacterized protein n=1 Tax=Rhododendron griersonianum TaxID=479676 RepID=A0AAV6IJ01_9ERIC|nr:hypothetical protein RHGRI_028770 [Rhododendron griersonianum]